MDKGINITPETIKLPEENTGKKILDIGLGNDFFFFFDMIQKVQAIKVKIGK